METKKVKISDVEPYVYEINKKLVSADKIWELKLIDNHTDSILCRGSKTKGKYEVLAGYYKIMKVEESDSIAIEVVDMDDSEADIVAKFDLNKYEYIKTKDYMNIGPPFEILLNKLNHKGFKSKYGNSQNYICNLFDNIISPRTLYRYYGQYKQALSVTMLNQEEITKYRQINANIEIEEIIENTDTDKAKSANKFVQIKIERNKKEKEKALHYALSL